jgi:hypothetical protein
MPKTPDRDWWDRPVEGRPEEHEDADRTERDERIVRPVQVASLPFEEALLVAGRLRADGIPATVYPPQQRFSPYGISREYHGVIVPSEFEDAARREVEEFTRSEG